VTIGVYTFELHLQSSRSLKSKRQVVKRLKDRLRSRHNIAICESEEYADLWQRAALVVVAVASRRDVLSGLFETIHRQAEREVPGQIIETGMEFWDEGGA
jgi:uncharacterized protein YlxP (DUF503 family)